MHKYLLVLVACTVCLLTGCASSDATRAPQSGETAVTGEKSAVPPGEKPATVAEEGAERPEATSGERTGGARVHEIGERRDRESSGRAEQ